jgi:hypothetical protein
MDHASHAVLQFGFLCNQVSLNWSELADKVETGVIEAVTRFSRTRRLDVTKRRPGYC